MNKLSVEVRVPTADCSFDAMLPYNITVAQATEMLKKIFEDIAGDYYEASGNALLCSARTGMPYPRKIFVCEMGEKNGSKLILI